MGKDHAEVLNQDNILDVSAAAADGCDDDSLNNAGSHLTSSATGLEQKNSTMLPVSPEADDKHDTTVMSEDQTDSAVHEQPHQLSKETSSNSSPQKSSPQVSSINDQSTSSSKPILDSTHLAPTTIGTASHEQIPSEITNIKVSSKDESSSAHSSSSKDHKHIPQLPMDNSRHKNSQFTSKNPVASEHQKEYVEKPSPQEDSWVKQLFVAREKTLAQDEEYQRRQKDKMNDDKKHFASNTAKFTTVVEEPLGGMGKAGLSNYEEPKAGLFYKVVLYHLNLISVCCDVHTLLDYCP